MDNKRDITFDIMKGIGIILMMTCHFFGWNHLWLSRTINAFHMPMFFIVAGYFSKPDSAISSSKKLLGKYCNRLIWPFAVTQLLLMIWAILMVFAKGDSWNSTIRIVLSTFWADPYGPPTQFGQLNIGVTWFLIALLVGKILLIPLSRLKNWSIPVSLILAYGAILLHKVFPYSIWCLALGLTALPYITIGWWIKGHKIPACCGLVLIFFWTLSILFSKMDMFNMDYGCYPLNVLGACGGTYFLYCISRTIAKHTKFIAQSLAILGIASLAILCAHYVELETHMTNHLCALIPFEIPILLKWVCKYLVTLGIAFIFIKAPFLKKIFR